MPGELSLKPNKKKLLNKIIQVSFAVWFGCVIGVFGIIGYVVEIRDELFDKAPEIFILFLLGFTLLGCFAFLIGIIGFVIRLMINRKQSGQKISLPSEFIKLFLALVLLPLYLWIYILRPVEIIKSIKHKGIRASLRLVRPKNFLIKAFQVFLVCIFIFPIWVVGYVAAEALIEDQLGYISQDINIVGTGSMYPTWPKGEKGKTNDELAKEIVSTAGFFRYPNGIVINGKRYLNHTIGRGDIVTATNDAIKKYQAEIYSTPSGVLKRVVALGGDTIELRDGVFYLNGEPQKEQYIAVPRSTYGEEFLRECQRYTIPSNSVFLMGDNRKGSGDSRGFGPVKYSDIDLVLPIKNQIGKLDKNWHNPENDLNDVTKPTINKNRFVELLNDKRKKNGATPVKYEPKLEKSAGIRGDDLLARNKIFEKTSYDKIIGFMSQANYWNSYVWEQSIEGYYSAEEIIEDFIERDSTDAREIWFDNKLDDIGIAEVRGTMNGCPTQIIVIHAAGYIPPNYSKEDIESWKKSLLGLREVQPGWASLKDGSSFYEKNKADIDRINEIISIRISNTSAIVTKMELNQWLTPAEQRMIDQDEPLYNEQQALAERLNNL